MMNRATRYNAGKPRMGLLPPSLLKGVAEVMTFGATKYEVDNWKKGLTDENCLSSCLRHITSYMDGEVMDKESGLPHIAHAACNLAFMLHFHKEEWFDREERKRICPEVKEHREGIGEAPIKEGSNEAGSSNSDSKEEGKDVIEQLTKQLHSIVL